jgi:hypothetical protein
MIDLATPMPNHIDTKGIYKSWESRMLQVTLFSVGSDCDETFCDLPAGDSIASRSTRKEIAETTFAMIKYLGAYSKIAVYRKATNSRQFFRGGGKNQEMGEIRRASGFSRLISYVLGER